MFRGRVERLHFVGVGGIGMSGIAEVLINLGFDVGGSDIKPSSVTNRLESLGLRFYEGHQSEHVLDADVVVVSSAINSLNCEVATALSESIPVIRRAEMLAELMRLKYGIAVAGSHGKTTTTSLIATIMAEGNLDPTMVIGGRLKSVGSNARLGTGEYLVAEADESDGSFLQLMPTIAVVTNVDEEHLDHWTGGLEQISAAFTEFVSKIPFYGAAILCVDHPNVQALLPELKKRFMTYGFSAQADYSAENIVAKNGSMSFTLNRFGKPWGPVTLNMIGRHNLHNALAALAVADEVGIDLDIATKALASFQGVSRRFEIKGERDGVLVVDDYGHHPAEIRATIAAAREAYDRRLVVVFQPHRYSRTRDLFDEFVTAFNGCHVLIVCEIYAASESPIEGVHANNLVEAVKAYGHQDAVYHGDLRTVAELLEERCLAGDLVVTLGAGDVWEVGEGFLEQSQTNRGVQA